MLFSADSSSHTQKEWQLQWEQCGTASPCAALRARTKLPPSSAVPRAEGGRDPGAPAPPGTASMEHKPAQHYRLGSRVQLFPWRLCQNLTVPGPTWATLRQQPKMTLLPGTEQNKEQNTCGRDVLDSSLACHCLCSLWDLSAPGR